uniref:Putative secreted protein n=1 Tax=Ixodes ricinus TaxID=34613 RepID=A0A6B0V3H0_IXORI
MLERPAVGILAALAGVGLSSGTVHGDGQRRVRFDGDASEAHGSGDKALHYLLGRFHFGNVQWSLGVLEVQLSPEGALPNALHGALHILRIGVRTVGAGSLLQVGDADRVVDVALPAGAPVVLAGVAQHQAVIVRLGIGKTVALHQVGRQHLKGGAPQAGGRVPEALVDHLIGQAHRFKDLGPLVAVQGRDAHLGHHLGDTPFHGGHVVLEDLLV